MPRLLWLVTVLAVLPAPVAFAEVPSKLSYQGVLTDAGGNLVPDGNYNLTFRIYDVSVGGAALYTENHPAVPVQLGGFSVIIGSVTPIFLTFDEPYWLGIQVGADPELAPRIELAASPYGLSLRLPFSGEANSLGAALDIENTGPGPGIRADRIDAGSSVQSGEFRVYANGSAAPTMMLYNDLGGGRILATRTNGSGTYSIEPDASGTGGFLHVFRSNASSGFFVDGNRNGTEQPYMAVTGSARSAVFDMSATENASVVLPTDAIGATEMVDEPGIGHINVGSVGLTSTMSALTSRTIDCPQNGYVVVLGSTDIGITHVSGTTSNAIIGLSTTPGILPSEQDFQMVVSAAAPGGTWDSTIGAHAVFAVNAGLNTFYMNGGAVGAGAATAFDINLTVMYFPTAYGTVTPPAPQTGPAGLQQEGAAASTGLTPADIAAERAEAETFSAARLQREIDLMRAELETIKRSLALDPQFAKER